MNRMPIALGVLLVISVLSGPALFSTAAPGAPVSSIGFVFWAVDAENINHGPSDFGIGVINVGPATASVQVHAFNPLMGSFVAASASVAPGASHTFALGQTPVTGPGISERGVYKVVSNQPLLAMQMNPLQSVQSNDAAQLIPEDALGTTYRAMTFHPATRQSSITIVSTQSFTTIRVTTTVTNLNGIPVGVPSTFIMNGFTALTIRSAQGGDLTGTLIEADVPVAVFAGAVCTQVTNHGACDILVEQTWPIEAWGEHYIVCRPPQRSTEDYTLRVMALESGRTRVSTTPALPGTPFDLVQGQWRDLVLGGDVTVQASQSISLGEFLHGDPSNTHIGDPSFTQILPTLHYRYTHKLLIPPNFPSDYLVITAESSTGITLDGGSITGWSYVSDPRYEGDTGIGCATVPVSDGLHALTGTALHSVRAYGYDTYGSYGYPVGGNAVDVPPDPSPRKVTWAAGDELHGELLVTGNDPGCGLGGPGSIVADASDTAYFLPTDATESQNTPATSLLGPRFFHAAATIDRQGRETTILVGGTEDCNFVPRADAERLTYNAPFLNHFRADVAMGTPRTAPAAATDGFEIYVFGGDTTGPNPFAVDLDAHLPAAIPEIRRASNTWINASESPAGLTAAAALYDPASHQFVVAGGASHPQVPNRAIQVYDMAADDWVGDHLPNHVKGHAAVECQGAPVVVGGDTTRGGQVPHMYEYPSNPDLVVFQGNARRGLGTWTPLGNAPGITYHGLAVQNSSVLVALGGVSFNTPTADVYTYSDCTNPSSFWNPHGTMPQPLAEHGAEAIGNSVYVFGGTSTSAVNPRSNRWEGGCPQAQAWAYTNLTTWNLEPWVLPVATASMGTSVLPPGILPPGLFPGESIIAVGGRVAGLDDAGAPSCHIPTDNVWIINPALNRVYQGPRLPEALIAPAVEVVGSTVYVAGGDETGDRPVPLISFDERPRRPSRDVYKLDLHLPYAWNTTLLGPEPSVLQDLRDLTWKQIEDMPLGVVHGRFVQGNGSLHVVGGNHHPAAAVRMVQTLESRNPVCDLIASQTGSCPVVLEANGIIDTRIEQWRGPLLPEALMHHGFEYDADLSQWVVHGGMTMGPLYHGDPNTAGLSGRTWRYDVQNQQWLAAGAGVPRAFPVGQSRDVAFATGTTSTEHRSFDVVGSP